MILFLFIILVQISACVTIPQEQLQGYASAFGAAREASTALYRTLDEAVAREKERQTGGDQQDCGPAQPAPRCFDPKDFLPEPSRPFEPSIEARVVTFEAVALYNETLIALASGATGEALANRLTALSGALNKVAQLTGAASGAALPPLLAEPVVSAFSALAVRLETVRANAEARAAILRDEVLIRETIEALIEDTPAVYALYFRAQGNAASSVPGAPRSPESVAELAKISEFHTALGAYVPLLDATRMSHQTLVAALLSNADLASQLNTVLDQALEIHAAGIKFRDAINAISD